MVLGMTIVAGVFALLQRMIERPSRTDCMAAVARSGIAARCMACRPLSRVASQARARGGACMVVSGGEPGNRVVAAVAGHQ